MWRRTQGCVVAQQHTREMSLKNFLVIGSRVQDPIAGLLSTVRPCLQPIYRRYQFSTSELKRQLRHFATTDAVSKGHARETVALIEFVVLIGPELRLIRRRGEVLSYEERQTDGLEVLLLEGMPEQGIAD